MTFDEYLKAVNATYEDPAVQWRRGQAHFNILYFYRPKLADTIRGTGIDPFHHDDRVPAFLDHLRLVWRAVL